MKILCKTIIEKYNLTIQKKYTEGITLHQKVQNGKQITNACYRTSEKNPIHNKCIHQRKQGM